MKLFLTEELSYSTVRIECELQSGEMAYGTGFFVAFKDASVPVVITNKHVIKDSKRGTLIFTKADANNEPLDKDHFNFYISSFESYWRLHPDPNVDLCAMSLSLFFNSAAQQHVKLFYKFIPMSLIPNSAQLQELSALEDIIMIGYPNALWDEVNNKPLFRKGVTATHPAFDFNGQKEFMIDAACFPGSSGSPVFLFKEGVTMNRGGGATLNPGPQCLLLGVLYAGPQQSVTGEIQVVNVPTSQVPVPVSSIPMNLGFVIKSERIKELEALF